MKKQEIKLCQVFHHQYYVNTLSHNIIEIFFHITKYHNDHFPSRRFNFLINLLVNDFTLFLSPLVFIKCTNFQKNLKVSFQVPDAPPKLFILEDITVYQTHSSNNFYTSDP